MKKRINKFLAEAGMCSRREADSLISSGKVFVNGTRAILGMSVENNDKVEINGKLINSKLPQHLYVIFNKPVGLITTTDETKPDNVISFLNLDARVFPVGRLDVESSGLLLLTNDGELANRIMHPRYVHEKEYEVVVDKDVTEKFLREMSSGVRLFDAKTKTARVEQTGARKFTIVLTEGKNRQVRKMCEALGYKVVRLVRVRVMNLRLGNLRAGEWRELSHRELQDLRRAIGL
jgi:23S rRNA pseudouridine2604 synthase